MRKDIVEIDENGVWVRDLSIYPVSFDNDRNPIYEYPSYYTETKPLTEITPFYRAKWTGLKWVESMTHEEIDALNNKPKRPTDEERLQSLELAILDILSM